MSADLLGFHYVHVVLASIWVGFLVSVIAASFKGSETLISVHRAAALPAFASLILLGLVGFIMASREFGFNPGAWFAFGTFTGRVGEKIIVWLVVAALGGYLNHVAIKKVEQTGNVSTYRNLAIIALLASLGAMLLGSMLTLKVGA